MKKLFIYYSHSGNGELVAEKMKELGYDIRRIKPKKDLSKKFFFAVMKGGFLAGINHKSKLIDYDNDISEYDEIAIGSPIWNGKLSSPINTVLSLTNLCDKKLNFILYSGGGSAPKAIKKLKNLYNCQIIELKEPKKYLDELDKLNNLN